MLVNLPPFDNLSLITGLRFYIYLMASSLSFLLLNMDLLIKEEPCLRLPLCIFLIDEFCLFTVGGSQRQGSELSAIFFKNAFICIKNKILHESMIMMMRLQLTLDGMGCIIISINLLHICCIYQRLMDKSDNLDTSKVTNPQKPKKKKYIKVEKKVQQPKIDASNINQNSFQLTKTEINTLSHLDLSSIHPQNISVITENSSIKLQSTFLGSQIYLKKELMELGLEPEEQQPYLNCKETIDDRDLLKVLKKYTKKVFQKAKNIEILYTQAKPALFLQFNHENQNEKRKMPLKAIIKANKQIGNQQKTIEDIFDKLYNRIGEQFHKILEIIFILADKQRIELNLNRQKLRKDPLLYYCIKKQQVNFALFDKDMRIFQFNSSALKKMKLSQKQEKIWKKFETSIQSRRKQGQKIIQQYGEYEASSDEQSKKTVIYEQKVDVQGIRKKIKALTSMKLDQYEDQIEEKQRKFDQMQKRNDHREKQQLERIAQDLGEMQNNLENFKETCKAVSRQLQSLRPADSQRYKNLLKKMILAKKQLESKLPITARKRQIFNALDKDNLIILEGETGSGKSTQLPQMMCEYFKMFDEKGKSTLPILITQPRKLATRTVAERVASQMEESVGGFVDYATSPHRTYSKTARIIFKMDSLVLDEITTDRLLSKYSCLIIDEAHERTISIDVILGLIKQLLTKRKQFKVIVTSASLDAKLFSEYFNKKVMKVSGRLHPVEIIHRSFHHESDVIRKIQNVIKNDILVSNSQIRAEYKGDVLVFCSGVEQINILCNIFDKYLNPRVFHVYPLHGRIAPSDQRLIFLQTKEHKIIFASRIAQTSITINGVKVVIDPGYDREEVYDQKNRVSSRKLVNISQSSAKQRAGRAGRTSKGFCFRLYSQAQMRNFRQNKTPEIENMALDTLVLRLKMLNVKEIFKFAYINKPEDKALEKSVETLQMIGALNFNGEITTVGKLLLQLRIQPFLGRAIVQAIICEDIIKKTKFVDRQLKKTWKDFQIRRLHFIRLSVVQILSMVINSSNLFAFLNQFDRNRDNLDHIKFKKFSDQRGDFFYLLNIYDEFIQHTRSGQQQLNSWLRSRFLNKKSLFQVKQLVEEINETIKSFNFDLNDPSARQLTDIIKIRMTQCKNADDVILSCMMTSFCVNLCLYSNNPNIGYTLILQKKPVIIYGTSTLALLSKYPKWIICYQLKTNDKGITYCQLAHEVDYKFLKRTVDDHVFQKLNLREAEHMNPFYQTIERSLPSLILDQISNDYVNRESLKMPLFKYLSLIVKEETNTVSISWGKQLKLSDIYGTNIRTSVLQYIENYIKEKINDKKLSNLNFHLMSNVYLQMKDGFVIKNVYFTSKQVEFIATGEEFQLYQIKSALENQNIGCKNIAKQKLKIFTKLQSQYTFVKQYLEKHGVVYEEFIKEKKEQSLNVKIYMKFYTGAKDTKIPIVMFFGKQNAQVINQMCETLQNCRKQQKIKSMQQKYRYFHILWSCKFKTSKNSTVVKCFHNDIDAFELRQAIQYLTVNGVLPYNFKLPHNYRQTREPDNALAIKTEKQWENQIQKVLARQGFKNISIKVTADDKYTGYSNNMQSMMRNELTAQLTGESIEKLDELVKKFDGKQKIIGAGKVHFRYNFKQFIVKVNSRAFKALKDGYLYHKDKYQNFIAQLKIESYERTFGKAPQVFIHCRSPNREKLLEPTQKIKQLFTPFIIRLESIHFNFLCNSQQGDDFIRKIQEDYKYHIYFGFQKRKSQIRVYCEQDQFQAIQERVLKIFQKYKFSVDNISYRGKGLNRVTDVIEKQIRRLHDINRLKKKTNQFLEYRIKFKTRQVEVEGDPDTINKIKKDISNLVNEAPGSCHICMKNTQRPYKLFNCLHSFCWKCLGDYIEQSRKEETNGKELVCPQQNCLSYINSYDMKVILSSEQFESFSMKRVREYVNTSKKCFFCPTSGCDQLFEEETVKKNSSFECYICGKWYCSKCKQPHEHFTCAEWESKLAKGQLSKFGFKRCKCGAVLQKEMREKMIQCKACKEYLCWVCIKGWKVDRDCQNHIKSCKK